MAQRSTCPTILTEPNPRQPDTHSATEQMPVRRSRRALLAAALGGGLLGGLPWGAMAAKDSSTNQRTTLPATSFYSNFTDMTLLDQDGPPHDTGTSGEPHRAGELRLYRLFDGVPGADPCAG